MNPRGGGEQDRLWAERVFAAEGGAIFRWAMEGAARAAEAGQLTVTQRSARVQSAWGVTASSVAAWLTHDDGLILTGAVEVRGHAIPAKRGFERYQDWATKNGYRPLKLGRFYDAMKDGVSVFVGEGPEASAREVIYRQRGKQPAVLRGVVMRRIEQGGEAGIAAARAFNAKAEDGDPLIAKGESETGATVLTFDTARRGLREEQADVDEL